MPVDAVAADGAREDAPVDTAGAAAPRRRDGSEPPARKRDASRSPERAAPPPPSGLKAPRTQSPSPPPAAAAAATGVGGSLRVVHAPTLVTLRPSASPRSHPLAGPLASPDAAPPPPLGPPARPALSAVVFGAARAQGLRPYMEDRHVTLDAFQLAPADGVPRAFAAVYDGHNGALAADHATARLHVLLAADPALRAGSAAAAAAAAAGSAPGAAAREEEARVGAALVRAFEATDAEILARCRAEGARGGATGVVLLRAGEALFAAHCGDSRAVLCRGGAPLRLTEDHKPNLPRERERVEALGGRVDYARCWRVIVDPGGGRPASGLAVSRSFGDADFKEPLPLVTATPDVTRATLTPADAFVVVASDGLWDVVDDAGAVAIAGASLRGARGAPAARAAEGAAAALVDAALRAGSMDNVTAVVAILRWGA
jgi:serine/threonine protein phosphatase PrpC